MSFLDPFLSPTQSALLRLLFRDQSRFWSQHELSRELSLPRTTIEHQVHRLVRSTVVEQESSGRKTFYKLNPRCPIRDELGSMLRKSYGIVEEIRELLLPFESGIRWAFVRDLGDDLRNSTIIPTAHVIGTIDYDELRPRIFRLCNCLGRVVRIDYQALFVFEQHVRLRHPAAMSMVKCQKIWMYGDPKTLLLLQRQRPRKGDRFWGPPPTVNTSGTK